MQPPNKITTGLLVEKLNTVNRNKIGAIFGDTNGSYIGLFPKSRSD